MKELKTRILKDGRCLPGGILKVDNFINHQMDPVLMKSMAVEFGLTCKSWGAMQKVWLIYKGRTLNPQHLLAAL